MPTLNWIGKEAVVKHHKEVPFRMLQPVAELSCGESANPENENLIVQGDNLHALKALLPRYAGQVKCIYIDPPYNTGNEGWVYNDNVNSLEIKRWLGEVVGKEGETLDRHDRWLCMMYPRLLLLKQFLREDGVIFISIDDNEVASLRLLMDEIFGERNFLGKIVWHNSSRVDDFLAIEHEYILVYFKDKKTEKELWKKARPEASMLINLVNTSREAGLSFTEAQNILRNKIKEYIEIDKKNKTKNYSWLTNYSNIDENWKIFYPVDLSGEGEGPPRYFNGKLTPAPKGRHWMGQDYIDELTADNRIAWRANRAYRKLYIEESQENMKGLISLPTRNGGEEIKRVFGKQLFDKPKPYQLIQQITQYILQSGDLILDSFAGSGTTAHAVLKQNADDGGNRRFILVEMDENIAQTVTAERVKRVSQGYSKANGETVAGLGGSFKFCKLSAEPLFTAQGQIRTDVTFAELAEFVWFTETGTGYPKGLKPSPLLGVYKGKAVYLLFNGILKDRGDLGGNVLNNRTLAVLPVHDGQRVVYGARTRFDKAKLSRMNLEFKQLPYELTVKSWV